MGVKLVKPIKHRSVASISASEFQNTLWTLKVRKNFAVAVSGGPDSLALLLLSKQYAETNNLKLTAISIDHSLRIDSGAEIQWIKKLTNRHKIRFSCLKWKGKKPESNIMAQAREKRYELLIKQCKKLELSYLLTAHHLDDEIENFLMRLIRGSGIKGLSSLSPKLKYKNSGITIARPLLNYPKKSLIKYLAINNQKYIEDPTNKNKRFDRTRIRELSTKLISEGLDKSRFSNVMTNLKKAENAIQRSLSLYINKCVKIENKVSLRIELKEFIEAPDEIQFRLLVNIAKLLGGKKDLPRAKSILNVIEFLNNNKNKKTTMHNCLFTKSKAYVLVSREIGRTKIKTKVNSFKSIRKHDLVKLAE